MELFLVYCNTQSFLFVQITSTLLVKHQGVKLCLKYCLCCISSLVCGRFEGEDLSFIRFTFVAVKFYNEQ